MPPKFITSRHIGEVFAKIGYKAETGKKIFSILCVALKRRSDAMETPEGAKTAAEASMSRGVRYSRDNLSELGGLGDPPSEALGTAAGIAEAALGGGHPDDSFDGAEATTGQFLPITPEKLTSEAPLSPLVPPSELEKQHSGGSGWGVGDGETAFALSSAAASGNTNSSSSSNDEGKQAEAGHLNTNSANQKMDVHDFMDACLLDDVLIQAVLRKPRQRFLALLAKVHAASSASTGSMGVASSSSATSDVSTGSGSDSTYNNSTGASTTEMEAAMGQGIDTSALEQELVTALALAEEEERVNFPLTNAAKNAMLDLAGGLASRAQGLVQGLTQNLLEEEGEDFVRDSNA